MRVLWWVSTCPDTSWRFLQLGVLRTISSFHFRTSLVLQWLGLCASTGGGQVQSPVRELRSCMLHDVAKKTNITIFFLRSKINRELVGSIKL